MNNIFTRHTNVALSFSGGKDSLACLHLLRPYWDKLTVYWMNPGNPFPETVELMRAVRNTVPNFIELRGRQRAVVADGGWPSDVIPYTHTTDGNAVFGKTEFKVQSRLDCCWRAMMLPTHEAMLRDGVTCCIRGKRSEEADKTGVTTGYIQDGIELVFPIIDWTKADVIAFLEAEQIPLPASYQHANRSLDCMDCTAWWGEGLSKYLAAEHPAVHTEYVRRIRLIKSAVADAMALCEVGD